MVFRVVSPPSRPPFVSYNTTSGSFYGYLVDLLPTLLSVALNTSDYSLNLVSTNLAADSIQYLQNGTADLVLFPLTLASSRIPLIDQTVAYNSGGLQILIKKQTEEVDPLTFLSPFETILWIVIVLVVFAVAPAVILLTKLTPLGAHGIRRMKRTDVPEEPVRKYAVDSGSGSFLLDAWMAQVGQAVFPKGRSWAVRMMSVAFGLYGIVVLAAYTANLTATLTDTSAATTISSMTDLLRFNSSFAVNAGGTDFAYFGTCTDPIIQQLQKNVVPVHTLQDGYESVLNGSLEAYVAENPTLLSFQAVPPCAVEVVGDPIGVGSQVLGLRKNSSYTAAINEAIQVLAENGTLEALHKKWIEYSATCAMPSTILAQPVPQLDVDAFQGLWYMLFVSMGLALVVVAIEHLTLAALKRHPTWHDKAQRLFDKLTNDGSKIFHETDESPNRAVSLNLDESTNGAGKLEISRTAKLYALREDRLHRQQSVTQSSIETGDAVLSSMMAAH